MTLWRENRLLKRLWCVSEAGVLEPGADVQCFHVPVAGAAATAEAGRQEELVSLPDSDMLAVAVRDIGDGVPAAANPSNDLHGDSGRAGSRGGIGRGGFDDDGGRGICGGGAHMVLLRRMMLGGYPLG